MEIITEQPGLLVFATDQTASVLADMTDENLLAAAACGDETAFRLLYERHRTLVFRFAYRLLQSIELAEEITHDCFLSLIKKPGRFDASRASLKTYLCAAARNQALKLMRRAGNETTWEEITAEPHTGESWNPLRQMIGAELAAVVRQAIAELPPLQREAVILFEYEELSLAEIALVVSADVGTVKSRLHRARGKLRERLAPYVKHDADTVSP
ncbi:MAG: RNA polymerase sigma factor [Blastocatellia bacterium]